jgi:hypothetical protein
MVLFRALGWLLLVMTVATAVQNGLTWWSEGAFRFLTLGDVWAHLDYGSLSGIQAYLTLHVSAHGWSWGAMPLLRLPALPVFLVLGLFCLWIGQTGGETRRSSGRPSGFAVGARRPRRRRGRGLL